MPFKGISYWAMSVEVQEKAREQISRTHLCERNPHWKGDNVGYYGLHHWIHSRLPKPKLCENCKKQPPYDLANKSKLYTRELNDWWWICRKCHMVLDERINNLRHCKTGWYHQCKYCGREHWVTPWDWNNGQGRYCSKACSNRGRWRLPKLPKTDD